jgi:hypothetical protein
MEQPKSKINALLNKLKMNCEHSCQLYSTSLDRELTFAEKMKVKFHFLICKWCARYAEQVGFIHQEAKKQREETTKEKSQRIKMSSDAKERLKQTLSGENSD